MYYRINWHASSKRVFLEGGASSAPAFIGGAGFTDLGTFRHEAGEAGTLDGMQDFSENHVLYHHVQEALYKQGVLDMFAVHILSNAARTLSLAGGTLSVVHGADSAPIAVTATPSGADKDVWFTSSDVTKATVDAKGVVHGVAAGSAVVTATLKVDPTLKATRNVTIT